MRKTVVAISLLAIGCGSTPAFDEFHGVTDAELEDIETIADQNGWSFDEAFERIGWQSRFVDLIHRLEGARPEDFAGAAITSDRGDYQAFIAFKSEIPRGFEEAQSLAGLSVDLRADRGYAVAELDARAVEVSQQLFDAGFQANTSYDIETGEVEVEIATAPVRRAFPEMDATSLVWSALPEAARARGVSIHLVDELAGEDEALTLYGGGLAGTCTSAYTVYQGSTRGMLTAGHCTNYARLANTSSSASVTSALRAEHEGMWGDFQWHSVSSPVTFSSKFYYDWGRVREAEQLRNVITGMTLCRFGQTTGRHCDEVLKTDIMSNGAHRIAAMRNDNASPGDSGGPYYYGNKVHGVHKGEKTIWFKSRDVFSLLKYVDEALGVRVLLNPPPPPPPGDVCDPVQCNKSCGGGECTSGGQCACW